MGLIDLRWYLLQSSYLRSRRLVTNIQCTDVIGTRHADYRPGLQGAAWIHDQVKIEEGKKQQAQYHLTNFYAAPSEERVTLGTAPVIKALYYCKNSSSALSMIILEKSRCISYLADFSWPSYQRATCWACLISKIQCAAGAAF